MVPSRSLRIATVVLFWLFANASLHGQSEPSANVQDLYLVVRAPRHSTSSAMETSLKNAFKKTRDISCDGPNIKVTEINRDHYNRLEQIASKGVSEGLLQSDVTIERDNENENRWLLYLGNPFLELERITVKFRDMQGKEQSVTYGPDDIGSVSQQGDDKKKTKVVARRPGLYFVTLDAGSVPDSYDVEVIDSRTEKKSKFSGKWPNVEKHFLIHLPRFKGQMDALIRICKDRMFIGEPVTIEPVDTPLTLTLGTWGDLPPGPVGQPWSGHTFTVSFHEPENRYPKRVLMMFPLTKSQAEEELKKFPGRGMQVEGTKISEMIRKEGKLIPSTAADDAIPVYPLNSSGPAHWYELPRRMIKDQAVFQASFEIQNIPEWKNLKEPVPYRVYAFEFDDGTPQVVYVSHPVDKQHVRIVDGEDPAWILGLNRIISGTEPATEK